MTWWLDSPPVGRSLRPWAASPAWPGDRENFTAVQASAASRSILVLHPPRDLPMDLGTIFCGSAGSVWLNWDHCTIEGHSLDGNLDHFRGVAARPRWSQLPRFWGMPIPKVLGQPTPLTAMLCHLQHGMEYLPDFRKRSALARQQSLDLLVCFFC